MLIKGLSGPNEVIIPELMDHSTVSKKTADALSRPGECLIFSSPNARNFKQMTGRNGLLRFVCPNWTLAELKLLEHGYGDRSPPEEVESLFERFGGSPRAVIANVLDIASIQ